jgi:hypothetical protein
MNVHLLDKMSNFKKLDDNDWESGWWKLDEGVVKKLVGGEIYFHKTRQAPSFYGGIITGYRIEQEGQYQGMIVFRLKHSLSCRNVKTGTGGWSHNIKIINPD